MVQAHPGTNVLCIPYSEGNTICHRRNYGVPGIKSTKSGLITANSIYTFIKAIEYRAYIHFYMHCMYALVRSYIGRIKVLLANNKSKVHVYVRLTCVVKPL